MSRCGKVVMTPSSSVLEQVSCLAEHVRVFRRAAEEVLSLQQLKNGVARDDVHAEKPPHLGLGQLKTGHLPVLGLNQLEKAIDARLH